MVNDLQNTKRSSGACLTEIDIREMGQQAGIRKQNGGSFAANKTLDSFWRTTGNARGLILTGSIRRATGCLTSRACLAGSEWGRS